MKAAPEDLGDPKGAMLAIVGTGAILVYDATGWKLAGRLEKWIEKRLSRSKRH